jgi:hypothetical protein
VGRFHRYASRSRAEAVTVNDGVEAVDQHLVGLAAPDEADGLVVRPGPHGDVVGRLREGCCERIGARLELGEQVGVRVGTRRVVPWCLQSFADDRAPEVLDLAEVPEQVGGGPVRAGRHGLLGVAVAEPSTKRADSARMWARKSRGMRRP